MCFPRRIAVHVEGRFFFLRGHLNFLDHTGELETAGEGQDDLRVDAEQLEKESENAGNSTATGESLDRGVDRLQHRHP